MRTLPLREAKATLSAVVSAAEQGASTTITKHGRPVAMIVPLPDTKAPEAKPSAKTRNAGLVDHLLSFPRDLDLSREPWTTRDIDL